MCDISSAIREHSGMGYGADKCKREQPNRPDNGKGDWEFRTGCGIAAVPNYKGLQYKRDLGVLGEGEETKPHNHI
jgi:hypothetical protein